VPSPKICNYIILETKAGILKLIRQKKATNPHGGENKTVPG
jgi:hypothetical protein